MKLYRITKEKYLNDLSGNGGSYKDGARWNSKGVPVLYFGTSPAVALLEMGNYLQSPRHVPKSLRLGIYEVPDSVKVLELADMPDDWNQSPYPTSTQKIGTDWLLAQTQLVLKVPSCAVAGGLDHIAVVNPLHPKARAIKLLSVTDKIYNERMFKGL